MDDCKFILCIRDSEDVWLKSYQNFFSSLSKKHGVHAGMIESYIWTSGFGGKMLYNTANMSKSWS